MAYIGTWPSTPGFNAVNLKAVTQTKQTQTVSQKTYRASTGTSRFEATIRYPNTSASDFRPTQAFAARALGSLNTFDIVLPVVSNTSGNFPSQTVFVSAAASVGASSVTVTSDQASSTILKAGDVVRFENHTKVYMLTADATSNGSGIATLNITPNLIVALDDDSAGGNTSVTVNAVPFRCFLSNDIQQFKHAVTEFISFEFDITEDI